jgi:hypothetical protein
MPLRITLFKEVWREINGGMLTWILMKMWLTCLLSHWVVDSESSLFGWFCIMYSLRKRIKLAVHGRRLTYVLASHKDGNCLPYDTHVVRFYISSWNGSWLNVSIEIRVELWASTLVFLFSRWWWLVNSMRYP